MDSIEISNITIDDELIRQAYDFYSSSSKEDKKEDELRSCTHSIFDECISIRIPGTLVPSDKVTPSSPYIKVSLRPDQSGDVSILCPKDFPKMQERKTLSRPKRRKLGSALPRALVTIPARLVTSQVEDAILCSAISEQTVPIAFAEGPFLHHHPTGEFVLRYSLAIVPDMKVSIDSQHSLALRFLSRACQDPSLAHPERFQASPWELLNLITLPALSSESYKTFEVKNLKTPLLPYQCETLKWCLGREGMRVSENGSVEAMKDEVRFTDISPPLGWRLVPNTNVWVNPYLLRTLSSEPKPNFSPKHIAFKGKGLLAEEMGLGKTLEMISLSLMNPRTPPRTSYPGSDLTNAHSLVPSKATLVIVPKTILYQWVSEVELHAPHLKTLVVTSPNQPISELLSVDFVFVTYNQLSRWLPLSTVRRQRNTRQNRFSFRELAGETRPMANEEVNHSSLIDVEFWRVILDEVQMVNSGASAAAQVARRIPRVHAWAVSGTPVRHTLKDLRGMISFLDIQPFIEPPCWRRFISSATDFNSTMKLVAIRHTKATVKKQLYIPEQHRRLILLKFSEIERARYNKIQSEFLEDEVHPNCNLVGWLLRLRQACSHAVAQSNSGNDIFALTKDQVLAQLLEESDLEVWTQQRDKFIMQLQLGQIYDLAYKLPLAFKEWTGVMEVLAEYIEEEDARSASLVIEARSNQKTVEELEAKTKLRLDSNTGQHPVKEETQSQSYQKDWHSQQLQDEGLLLQARRSLFLANGRVKSSKARCRSLKELLHRTYFFLATGHFRKTQRLKMKLNEEELSSKDIQDTIKSDHEQEVKFYKLAEGLRVHLLNESAERIEELKAKLKIVRLGKVSGLCPIPKADIADKLASFATEIFDTLQDLLTQSLIEDLVPTSSSDVQVESNGLTTENDAYAKTLDSQEFAHIYLEMLQVILRDRAAAINGGNIQPTPQIAHLEEAGKDLVNKLVDRREEIVALLQYDRAPLLNLMKKFGIGEKSIDSLKLEVRKAQNCYSALQELYNHRIEFYKQLQVLSDQVSDLDTGFRTDYDVLSLQKIREINLAEHGILEKLKNQKYLRELERSDLHEANETKAHDVNTNLKPKPVKPKCAICLDEVSHGAMTPCAHYFCGDCLDSWLPIRRTCPLCNRKVNPEQIYRIWSNEEYSEDLQRDASFHVSNSQDHEDAAEFARAKEFFVPITETQRSRIAQQQVVREYGVKIDTIVRHVMYLRSEDPLSQIVVFSQWGNMLKVLKTALAENKVTVASINDPIDNVNKFRSNPDVACLLLQAKVDVAGLTLVNANHVFLCEPLLNTAIEWQAVSRINRIGQMRETTVWQFCVDDTVERSILSMTTKSRLKRASAEQDRPDDEDVGSEEMFLMPGLVDKRSGSEITGDTESLRSLLPKAERLRARADTDISTAAKDIVMN